VDNVRRVRGAHRGAQQGAPDVDEQGEVGLVDGGGEAGLCVWVGGGVLRQGE
jgi:hypothetical protein